MSETGHASDDTIHRDRPTDASAAAAQADEGSPDGWQPTMAVASRRSWWPLATAVGVVALVVLAGGLMATRLPGGTTLAGTPVTHIGQTDAALDAAAGALADLEIRLRTAVGTETTVTADDIGLGVDRTTSAQGLGRGLPSLGTWVQRVADGAPQIPFTATPPPPDALAELAAAVSREPLDAEVAVDASGVEVVPGADGISVDAGQIDAAIDAALEQVATTAPGSWPAVVEADVSGEVTPPVVTQADVDAVLARVEAVESADVTIVADTPVVAEEDSGGTASATERTETAIELTDRELRAVIDVETDVDQPEGSRLRIVPSPETAPPRVVALLDLARVRPKLEARIVDGSPTPERGDDLTDVSDITGEVVVSGQEPGFEPDREATLDAVIDVALDGGGEVAVIGQEESETDPADIGIVEPISTFTTFYTPGESRNTNIRRIAEIVDGTVIPAGESYELNHAVGRRTTENGFTLGGAILDGELVSDVGGGVSQFATTFFNAAWFAGVELVDWKPHSFYFDRYPAGREATINYPNVNLEIRNDTPHAILVDTDADADSVTVTFWSTPYWDVETVSGPCPCGGSFRITVDRIRTAPGGTPIEESYTTIYSVPQG